MSIHIAPSTLHLRFFNDGNGSIEGVTFTITRRHFSELKKKLPAFGIKQVSWRHKGKEQRIVLVKEGK